MENAEARSPMPLSKILLVLAGFPVVSTLISLMLLKRSLFSGTGLAFFTVFWTLIIVWYLVQILLVSKVLKSSGWNWTDIGYSFDRKRTIYFISAYLIFAFGLFGFIELALAHANLDPGKVRALSDLSNLTPKTAVDRIIFIFMGLVAGLAEELVYRGFAINTLKSRGINQWLAAVIAAIPFVFQHGLKSIHQFWWFLIWGLVFGVIFNLIKKIHLNIAIHWLVILSALLAILKVLK